MKMVGFHGTCSKWRRSIDVDGLDPSKTNHRSDHWLGQGVYFFDDDEKAMWWANVKTRENRGSYALIYEADIEALDEEILDLDDNSQLDHFMNEILQALPQIKKSGKAIGKMPIFTDEKMRAVFFDYYKKKHNISVIIHTFQKNAVNYVTHRNPNELHTQKQIMKAIGIYYKERQICVSNKDCIKSQTLIYNEEEEVI